jgi:hypothetical protein
MFPSSAELGNDVGELRAVRGATAGGIAAANRLRDTALAGTKAYDIVASLMVPPSR